MYTQCPRKSNWDKYTRATLQPKPCHPFFVILPRCISLSHSPDRMLDNSYVAVTRMNEFRGRKQCVHVSMSLMVFVCDRLCHCMLVPRNFFIFGVFVCIAAHILWTPCIWRVTLHACTTWQMAGPLWRPREKTGARDWYISNWKATAESVQSTQ